MATKTTKKGTELANLTARERAVADREAAMQLHQPDLSKMKHRVLIKTTTYFFATPEKMQAFIAKQSEGVIYQVL